MSRIQEALDRTSESSEDSLLGPVMSLAEFDRVLSTLLIVFVFVILFVFNSKIVLTFRLLESI